MSELHPLSRRDFLKFSAVTGAGLCIGISLTACSQASKTTSDNTFQPNAYLRISNNGAIIISIAESEMGQGVMTSLSMLVAEELDADWTMVKAELAPADRKLYGRQSTGGSSSVREAWQPMRKAGAAARQMLIQAAAKRWSVNINNCRTEKGRVYHDASGQSIGYGELSTQAAQQPLPENIQLKDPGSFQLIGRATHSLDGADKIHGRARFGMDIRLPGMVYATITHPPVFGGKLKQFDAEKARQVNGVQDVISIDQSVVVIAENSWAALQGQKALQIEWENGQLEQVNSVTIRRQLHADLDKIDFTVRSDGHTKEILANTPEPISVEYELPYQAHFTMEPQCCVAHVHDEGCEVWAPTQSPSSAKSVAAKYGLSKSAWLFGKLKKRIDGSDYEDVKLHVPFLGTGFGRRRYADFVKEAVKISRAIGKPVNLFWSREEDTQHGFYRPTALNRLEAALGQDGLPIAWRHHISGPSIGDFHDPDNYGKNKIDNKMVGGAKQLPYAIPNIEVSAVLSRTPVPLGTWRSVGSSLNGFVVESFIDELAHAAQQDPVEYRRKLLQNSPRRLGVLKLAAEKAGWGQPLPKGIHRGIAIFKSFLSYVAQVAEVSVSSDGELKVHRVVCAVDCGMVVNPDGIQAQMEGAVAFALTATLKGEITINQGRVEQSNYHDYPVIRMSEMPKVETYLVPSAEAPTGIGEPGVPPLAAAVANATFAATGIRVRHLPIRAEDLILQS
ncbi:MAG: xanthine dehydrogenase family protein molybdopterin-binding subunit [Candidatus Polarisedimenticolaceae bacterium]|nr:xanthine dehydrogenase family protein molybdopterin-binding subunit [Candidatus Polarisedimenticolaceae bacterium]